MIAVGLSAYRIQQSVKDPFLVDRSKVLAFRQSLTPSEAEEEARLKRMDTDGDGLSDWDEINVHRTNPNLKDTCGDGVIDNVRILTGQNLACTGKGTNVPGEIDISGVQPTTSSVYGDIPAGLSPESVYSDMIQAGARARASSTSAETSLPRDAALIRAALQGKVEQDQLDALSDSDLLKLYDEALAAQTSGVAPASP